MSLCAYCSGEGVQIEHKDEIIQRQQILIDRLIGELEKLKMKCNVRKQLNKYFTEIQQKIFKKNLIYKHMTEHDYCEQMDFHKKVKMITITFDPAKFKDRINDKDSQRDYILTIIGKMYAEKQLAPFFGCFELHQNGRVHAHILTSKVSDKLKKLLSEYFTDNKDNEYAVQIHDKETAAGYVYITKKETKDPDYEVDQHFFYSKFTAEFSKICSVEIDDSILKIKREMDDLKKKQPPPQTQTNFYII